MSAHRSNAAIGADIAKEADKPTPAQLVAEASVVVRLAATQWRPAYALARTIATIGDLQSAVTDLAAENARLRTALHSADWLVRNVEYRDDYRRPVWDDIKRMYDEEFAALSPAPAKKENEHG